MVKKQHITFGGLFLPLASLKIPAFAGRQAQIAKAMPAFFALPEKKIGTLKYDTLFLYHFLGTKAFVFIRL